MNDPILEAHVQRIMDEAPEMKSGWDALEIEWHCPGRHGVVRDVPSADAGRIQRVIEWHMGHNACRWTKAINGKRSVEFVAMSKVSPPPRKPWEWCGETVLFGEWMAQETSEQRAVAEYLRGDEVWFNFRGVRKTGLVIQPNRRTVSVMVAGEGRYTVPPTDLHHV